MLTRTLQPSDADSIELIARKLPGFTIPSTYLVWMLSVSQRELCCVCEGKNKTVIGYLLAIPYASRDACFVWQLGVENIPAKSRLRAALKLLESFRKAAKKSSINFAYFTCRREHIRFINSCLSKCGSPPATILSPDTFSSVPTENEIFCFTTIEGDV